MFGAGVAGLTAAHELAERGFSVTVYERRALGGKARSTEVPGTGTGGRRALPGEHGFRIEFGFYQNLPDTLRRIPFGANRNGVFDNLVAAPLESLSRQGERDLVVPLGALDPRPYTAAQVQELLLGALLQLDLPPAGAAYFVDRLTVYLSSCDARRIGQWQHVPWSSFIAAEYYGGDYQRILANVPTHFLQASKADGTSADFAGWVFESFVYTILGRGSTGPLDRVFNLPTNEAWIAPWIAELQRLGVDIRVGEAVEGLVLGDRLIASATVRGPDGVRPVVADYYVCALPVERARSLWTPAILAADPGLAGMARLSTDWMNGIQLYVRESTSIVRGHLICLDSPWAVSAISQAQFWARDFASSYGNGEAKGCVSAVISDWNTPGVLYGKPARQCTRSEIAAETWEQIKRHLNDSGHMVLTDDLLLSVHLDPGIIDTATGLDNEDPLVLPKVGAWQDQPDVATRIDNLVLAGDYVRGEHQMANMEAANEGGRRAANAILERSRLVASPAAVYKRYRPPEWDALKRIDEVRYRAGLPNQFDVADLLTALPLGS